MLTRARASLGSRPSPETVFWLVVVGVTYFGAARLGRSVVGFHGTGAVVSPAAGIGVAAVILGGRRMLPAIALGALATMVSLGEGAAAVLLALLAATLKPWIAAGLLGRVRFDPRMRRTSDVVAFVALAAVVAPAIGAIFGALSLLAGGTVPLSAITGIWRDLWLGSVTGVLVVGSMILVLVDVRPRVVWSRAAAEVAGMSAVVGLVSVLLLDRHGALPDLVLPFLCLLAFGYRQRGAAVGTLFVSSVAIVLTAHGHGPFIGDSQTDSLIRAEAFVCVGSVTALLVAAALSERHFAEQALARLAQSESALAEAQRVAHVGSFDVDLVAGTAIWSDETCRILGRDPRGFAPTPGAWIECVHPDDRERVTRRLGDADDDLGESLVHRIVRPDGQVRTVDLRVSRECDAGGTLVRILGTCQDVTAVKLAEERFRSLFEDAPYPLIVLDGEGVVVLGNARAQQLFGAEDGLEGRPVDDFVTATEEVGDRWYSAAADAPDGLVYGDGRLELRGRRASGTEFPVEVTVTPLAAEEGPLVSVAIRDVTELRAAAEILNFQARHDALTGLPNRLMFTEQLEGALARARRSGRPLAVVFIDLDDFKIVNDTRGHDVGDVLLSTLTPRLTGAIRDGDTLARLGGDEFVVLCEDLSSEDRAMEVAQRLVDVSRRPLEVAGRDHAISLSAGVVLVTDPQHATVHEVLRDADAAMYTAKGGGKGRASLFDQSARERLVERVEIESLLRGARDRDELELYYQPVVALADTRPVSVEALLRWRHPAHGLLSPGEFIDVAESAGLIAEIGEWVFDTACRQAVVWRDTVSEAGPLPVSVNVSAYELTRTNLSVVVQRALERTGLEPELLELEVTESALLGDIPAARRELGRLKALGVRLVVDDFGTGYSSLTALRSLSIDELKLDRSFLSGLDRDGGDSSLIAAVLGLAKAIEAEVTAEGVETWEQVAHLRSVGCDYAQGYLFARPAAAGDVTALLVAGQASESVPG